MKTINLYLDEAGRGPLAWPMTVGIIQTTGKLTSAELEFFDDSKKFSEKKREILFDNLQELKAKGKLFAEVGMVTNTEIDYYGMSIAEQIAIVRAFWKLLKQTIAHEKIIQTSSLFTKGKLKGIFEKEKINLKDLQEILNFREINAQEHFHLIIDGNRTFGIEKILPQVSIESIVHGDALVKEIGMASIMAKVTRDRRMESLPQEYEKYQFWTHKGYGTKLHKELIEKYEVCDLHRKLFLKWIFPDFKIHKEKIEVF